MPFGSVHHSTPTRLAGFTLIELVIVLVLLGVLGAVVIPRITEGSFRNAAFAEQVATAFRYSQRLAVATGCEVQVSVSSSTHSYSVTRRNDGTDTSCGGVGAFTTAIGNPAGGGAFAGTAVSGVTVTQGLTIVFNGQGLPNPNGGTVLIGNRSIVIQADTGYVQ
jgi:MSHA pilin protein MshC